jgi:hypothetical protein
MRAILRRGRVVTVAVLAVALATPAGLILAAGASGPAPLSGPPLPMAAASTDASTGNTGNSGNTGNTGAGTGTGTTTTTTTLPPAPAGYATSWTDLYDDMYATAEATGIATDEPAGTTLPAPADFSQMINQLTPDELAQLYQGTSNLSGWSSLPSTYQSLTALAQSQPITGVPLASASSGASTRSAATAAASSSSAAAATPHVTATSSASGSTSPFPPTEPTGSFPSPPDSYQPSLPIGPTQILECPAPAPGDEWGETGIYAATVAASVIDDLEPTLEDTLTVEVDPPPVSVDVDLPDPALIALAVAAGAAKVIADTFTFEHNYWAYCLAANLGSVLTNIDNTTVNTYELLTLMQSTLDNVESSVDTVSAQVGVVQQTEDEQLTLNIQQALTAPAGSAPNAAYVEPASVGGNLDSTPIGVQEVVTNDLVAAQAAGIAVNPAANQDLAAGNVALTNGQYKAAYNDFHEAYLEAAQ